MAGHTEVVATGTECPAVHRTFSSGSQAAQIVIVIVNILVSFFGTVANGLIITAYCQNRRIRNMQNFIFLALATTDINVTAFVQPLFIITVITIAGNIQEFQIGTIWKLAEINSFTCLNLSLATILILSLQSFITLAYPYRYQNFITKYRLKIIVFFSWFLVLSITIIMLFFDKLRNVVLGALVLAVLTVFIVVFTWVWTYKLVTRHRRAIKCTQTPSTSEIVAEKKILRSTVTAIAIILSLLVCYIPSLFFLFHYFLNDDWGFDKNNYYSIWTITMTMTYANSLVNPCLVFWRNSSFRETVRGICRRN